MKKKISLLLILSFSLLLAISLWSRKSPQSPINDQIVKIDPKEILQNDLRKIEKHIDPVVIHHDEWKNILSYEKKPESFINKKNSQQIFEISRKAVSGIYYCLKKDFCGMTSRGEDDAYFDDLHTPSHIMLSRNLDVMNQALSSSDLDKKQMEKEIDWNLIYKLAEEESELLSVKALELIEKFSLDGEKTSSLLKISKSYTGTAKADALLVISKNKTESSALLLASELEEIFEMSDSNTVLSVLEKVKEMSLDRQLIEKASINLCRFKNNENEVHNYKMIKYELKNLNLNLDNICQ
jgi:hypothetical protein